MVIRKGIKELEHQRKKLDANIQKTAANTSSIEDVTDALIELGELFSEQDDALVELAGIIGEGE